jgi:glycosyltransferase involved in cell wall biosynthesis
MVSFERQYPQWLFPGQSDRDPSSSPLKVKNVNYCIDSLNPFTWWQTFRRIQRYDPDIIVLQWWTTFWGAAWWLLGFLIRQRLRKPLIFVCHNVLPHESRMGDRWLARVVLRHGTHFVVQSTAERQRLHELLPQANITVVPLPIYDMFLGESLPQVEARAKLDLPVDSPVLLFFGIVRAYKGLMDLIEALPEIRATLGEVLLLVVGEFWDSPEPYKEQIAALGLTDCVRIENRYVPNEEIAPYFYAADLVVAPYRRATGSGVVQTAIGFGIPLLTTLRDFFDSVKVPSGCLLVPPQDSAALAAATIEFFSQSVADRQGQGTEALQSVFSWERLGDTLEGIGREVSFINTIF